MALTQHKITDYKGLDMASLPDKLTGTAAENKAVFDRTVKQVVAVSVNGLIEELEALGADSLVTGQGIRALRLGADGQLEPSADGNSFQSAMAGGHAIFDSQGRRMVQRARLQFQNTQVTDDGRTTIVDDWSVDTLRRWKGNGDYKGKELTSEEKALQAFYSRLLNLCNSEEALSNGQFYGLQYANPQSEQYDSHHIFSYLRGTESQLLLIATNFSDSPKECAITIPEEAFAYFGKTYNNKTCNAVELLTGKKMKLPLNPQDKIETIIPANSGVIIKFSI